VNGFPVGLVLGAGFPKPGFPKLGLGGFAMMGLLSQKRSQKSAGQKYPGVFKSVPDTRGLPNAVGLSLFTKVDRRRPRPTAEEFIPTAS